MCGIAGAVDRQGRGRATRSLASAMAAALHARGPDADGAWATDADDACFGHTRLSIIDLSPAGGQPMVSADRRLVITFNGEIYNHEELRRSLPERSLRGHSDTEVLLELLARDGIDRTLDRVNGMFAFAVWDHDRRSLTLARDRLGEKPLYLATTAEGLVAFASDLAALRPVPGIHWTLDRSAVAGFLKRGFIGGGRSVYEGVRQIPPATVVEVDVAGRRSPVARRYWTPSPVAAGRRTPDVETRADECEALLRDSVALRTFADVPVGAFLSGGIDSSLVVALMQQVSGNVRTFSIGFNEPDMDEAPHAREVARHLGTDHTEVYLDASDALAVVPKLPEIYTEPFADPSQIPTYLVSAVAREQVKVCLSGDGGDELFGGYDRYARTIDLWRRIGTVPRPARRLAAVGLGKVPPAAWSRAAALPYRVAKGRPAPPELGHKVRRLGEMLGGAGPDTVYDDLFSLWPDAHLLVPGAPPQPAIGAPWRGSDALAWMTAADLEGYLPEDILVKVDRAAMARSLEVRVPLLDHRVVELAVGSPPEDKLVDGRGKMLLRRILARHVPPALFERPKMGFGAPIDRWLRGPLRPWAEELLDPAALAADDLLDPQPIRRRWEEHQSGSRNWQYSLWAVIMLQQWRRHEADRSTPAAG